MKAVMKRSGNAAGDFSRRGRILEQHFHSGAAGGAFEHIAFDEARLVGDCPHFGEILRRGKAARAGNRGPHEGACGDTADPDPIRTSKEETHIPSAVLGPRRRLEALFACREPF